MIAPAPFDLSGPIPTGTVLLEASAGTGKTYAVAAIATRLVIEGRVTMPELLVVTFTRNAAAELRERIRLRLADAAALLGGAPVEGQPWLTPMVEVDAPERARRQQRVATALLEVDAAAIGTIHGFCQTALRQGGLRAGALRGAELADDGGALTGEVIRDVTLSALMDDLGCLGSMSPTAVEQDLTAVVRRLGTNLGAPAEPTGAAQPVEANHWAEIAEEVRSRAAKLRRRRGVVAFDDLILGLHDLVLDPSVGDDTCRALRERYRLVLIDEFQDTDPIQWATFSRAFIDDPDRLGPPSDVFLVGDPKQAIYQFRGADIRAYLDAVERDGVHRFTLGTNHRSDRRLIDALNGILSGATFGDQRVRYLAVEPRPGAPDHALTGDRTPVQIRWLPRHPSLLGGRTGTNFTATTAEPIILADVVAQTLELVHDGAIEADGVSRPVRPGDIAVLTRSNADAADVADALRRAGIPVVQVGTDSVLDTAAADQWALLLAALASPREPGLAAAVALGWFFAWPPERLARRAELRGLHAKLGAWRQTFEAGGVSAFFQRLRDDATVLAALATGEESLDRRLTDLAHIAELLDAALGPDARDARAASEHLARLRSGVGALEDETSSDERLRRIETDGSSVQVMTVHRAKGLEFPIVLAPFLAKQAPNRGHLRPYVYADAGGRRVDAAPSVDWSVDGGTTPELRHGRALLDAEGDALRLLYVAFTRAQHQLILWFAPTDGVGSGMFARLLLADRAEPPADPDAGEVTLDLSEHIATTDTDLVAARRAALVRAAGPGLAIIDLGDEPAAALPPYVAPSIPQSDLDYARLAGRRLGDGTWKRWSYSTILDAARGDRGRVDHLAAPGEDEPPMPETRTPDPGGLPPIDGGRANRYGTVVHRVLEACDFTSDGLAMTLEARAADELARAGLDVPHGDRIIVEPAALARGLFEAIEAPVAPLGTRLRDVSPADRLAELQFQLELPPARVADIARLVAEHSPQHDPHRDYFDRLAASVERPRGGLPIRGLLYGEIDALIRVGGRYTVVDYKTNTLPTYDDAALVEAMHHGDYPLQAILYAVATHRFLRSRLAGYSIDEHLLGATYLFLRGMQAGGGVHHWAIDPTVVLAVDALLEEPR